MKMIDREKIIKGLEEISDEAYSRWVHCQYTNDEIIVGIGKYMDDTIKYLKQSEWINARDRLPEKAGCYLVYRPYFWKKHGGQSCVCYWNGEYWCDSYNNLGVFRLSSSDVSHWMPLPESPEEKQE